MFLEESAEGRGIGEAEFVGDFLDGLARTCHEEDGTADDCLEDKVLNSVAADALHHRGEIFGRETQTGGIEGDTALLRVVVADKGYQFDEDVNLMSRRLASLYHLAVEDRAKTIGETEHKQLALVPVEHR